MAREDYIEMLGGFIKSPERDLQGQAGKWADRAWFHLRKDTDRSDLNLPGGQSNSAIDAKQFNQGANRFRAK